MARRTVDPPDSGALRGSTLGERLADAIRRYVDDNKSEFARRVGKDRRLVHSWLDDEKRPDADSLRLIAETLPVTLEELLGVATGQAPPFPAWVDFLATPEGLAMTPGERRALQSIAWPPGRAPTVASYQIALAAMRTTLARPS